MRKLDSIKNRFTKRETMIAEINNKVGVAERQVEAVNKRVSEQANSSKYLAQQVKNLKDKGVDLKNRIRRPSLGLYGVKDNHSETWDQSENIIECIFKTSLGIELTSVQRAHQIGRYNHKKKNRLL